MKEEVLERLGKQRDGVIKATVAAAKDMVANKDGC